MAKEYKLDEDDSFINMALEISTANKAIEKADGFLRSSLDYEHVRSGGIKNLESNRIKPELDDIMLITKNVPRNTAQQNDIDEMSDISFITLDDINTRSSIDVISSRRNTIISDMDSTINNNVTNSIKNSLSNNMNNNIKNGISNNMNNSIKNTVEVGIPNNMSNNIKNDMNGSTNHKVKKNIDDNWNEDTFWSIDSNCKNDINTIINSMEVANVKDSRGNTKKELNSNNYDNSNNCTKYNSIEINKITKPNSSIAQDYAIIMDHLPNRNFEDESMLSINSFEMSPTEEEDTNLDDLIQTMRTKTRKCEEIKIEKKVRKHEHPENGGSNYWNQENENIYCASQNEYSHDQNIYISNRKNNFNEDENTQTIPTQQEMITYTLNKIFNLPKFRPNQEEIVSASLKKRDIFVLMPTGGGKSLCYQLPALLEPGITIVISPLLSLIRDQLRGLLQRKILCLALNSSLSASDKELVYSALAQWETGNNSLVKIFYLTPESICHSSRLRSILTNLHRKKLLSRFVIDEAHCVSQWGHDFRPDYAALGPLRKTYNGVPMIALTATANPRVVVDIVKNLCLENVLEFKSSFNRPNLKYFIKPKTKSILGDIVAFILTYFPNSSGIIYALSKKECEMISESLNLKFKMKTAFYHAGLSKSERIKIQEAWDSKSVLIIVATVAFGMGIDKGDVRFIIHHSIPKSITGYYQETGRGGRDGLDSFCILYYSYGDKRKIDFLISKGRDPNGRKELDAVIKYCEDNKNCRRKLLMSHFGEEFTEKCTGCDNCERTEEVVNTENVNIDKKQIISLVESTGEISRGLLVDVFRGSKSKKAIAFKSNFYYGKGKDYNKEDVESAVKSLILEGDLKESIQKTGSFCYNTLSVNKRRRRTK